MNWKEKYRNKILSPEDAVKHIPSNSRVVVGHAVGEPAVLLDAMVDQKEQFENVEIVHMVPMGKAAYTKEGMEKHFRHNAFFVGRATRDAVLHGRADYTPCYFNEVPGHFTTDLPVDVALIQLSPPDEEGWCSFGTSVDYTLPATKAAKMVIAEINPHMPRTHGQSLIHLDDLDILVEVDYPIPVLPPPAIGDVECAIGEHCAQLIQDGDTLQLGIGAIPDAVLLFLKEKKDLGIHSEMISDGVVELVEAGVVTCNKKNHLPGKIVVTFLMGSERLYRFVHDNPMVEMLSVDIVNDPRVIMLNDNLVSINSAVQVDLMGQVASESIGPMQISGVGGQVDFVRGANWSKGGRSIIAMPSTTGKGKVSKIVLNLDEGSAVTTSRNDVDYVITEYGIAHLKGKTLGQRAEQLISIAHPDFREDLKKQYSERFAQKTKE